MSRKYIFFGVGLMGLLAGISPLLAAAKPFQYPMETKVTLRYLMEPMPNLSPVYSNFGETVLAQELQKRTGVRCKYIHPPQERTRETLDLMAASGNLPDVIETAWTSFAGGPNAAMNNGYIRQLNRILPAYAPNLTAWLKSHPSWDKEIKTDEGDYYAFPFIRPDERLLVTAGPVIRMDWVQELNLLVPETPEEWHTVLKAFKDRKGAIAPLSMNLPQLQTVVGSGFDVSGNQQGFYVEDRQIRFSFTTPQYKRFLMTMNQWFAQGLLDSNFANLTTKARDTNILTGKSGIVEASAGSGISVWMNTMRKSNSQFEVAGLTFPTVKKGQKAKFAKRTAGYGASSGSAAIGSKCRQVEVAARMLDYNYSREGSMLLNFGVENVSYQMVNGRPVFTNFVTHDPKLPMAKVLARYTRSVYNGPFIQDVRYIDQYYNLPQQREGQRRWMDNDYRKYMLPALTPSDQESMQIAQIMNDIQKYITEMSIRFIMGVEPFNHYDAYVKKINDMGLRKALVIYQRAYGRYLKR